MLTKRIIACLDVKAGRVVKGVQFRGSASMRAIRRSWPSAMHAAAPTRSSCSTSPQRTKARGTLLDTVARTASELFVPFTVGGGIRTAEDAAAVFDAGADKVSINSAAIADPALIGAIGRSFGAQAVIVAIDARRGRKLTIRWGRHEVYVDGGRKRTGRGVLEWACEAEARGAGEILLTSMDADGTRSGFDCELTARSANALQHPGHRFGRGRLGAAFRRGLRRGRADAALAASIFTSPSPTRLRLEAGTRQSKVFR